LRRERIDWILSSEATKAKDEGHVMDKRTTLAAADGWSHDAYRAEPKGAPVGGLVSYRRSSASTIG
jgi:hypothetical protein